MKAEKTGKRIIPVILILGIWLMLTQTVAAAESENVILTVEQEFDGLEEEETDGEGMYRLTALNGDVPMPEGSKKDGYSFSLKGRTAKKDISLRFARNGCFMYTLTQVTEDRKNYAFDREEYRITIHIKKSEKGSLVPIVIVENKEGEKCGSIKFRNSYKGIVKPESGLQGDNGESGDSSQSKDSVKTDDSSHLEAWLMLCLLSLGLTMFFAALKQNAYKER